MKLNFILPATLALLVSACAVAPEPTPEKFYIIRGMAVGDPCSTEGMFIDTPRGFPRICINGKWVPLCERADLTALWQHVCADYSRARAVPKDQ